jgi:hypothetical protein
MTIVATSTIRFYLQVRYPQITQIANNIKDLLVENGDTATTTNNIIDNFINDAKEYHDDSVWGDSYTRGVTLLTCHFITLAQPKSINSGVVISEKAKDSVETYMRPSLKTMGQFGTTKYGMEWEALNSSFVFPRFLV